MKTRLEVTVFTVLSGVKHDPSISVTATGDAPLLRCEPFRRSDGNDVVLNGLLAPDYPVLVVMEPAK